MSSPVEKTEAIVLSIAPYSQSSHVLTWITPRFGRIGTIVKGACRPKSWFLGQYDLFYTCELLFYLREQGSLQTAKECSPLKRRDSLRTDWRACIMASYMCGLISQIAGEGSTHPELYTLLDITLDTIAEREASIQCMTWFELRLLDALGLAPRTHNCAQCSGPVVSGTTHRIHFSHARGGSICARCSSHNADTITLTPPVFAMMRSWQKASSPLSACNTASPPAQLAALSNLVGSFAEYHLGFRPRGRVIALEAAGLRREAKWQKLLQANMA